jgi:hypothetical protein
MVWVWNLLHSSYFEFVELKFLDKCTLSNLGSFSFKHYSFKYFSTFPPLSYHIWVVYLMFSYWTLWNLFFFKLFLNYVTQKSNKAWSSLIFFFFCQICQVKFFVSIILFFILRSSTRSFLKNNDFYYLRLSIGWVIVFILSFNSLNIVSFGFLNILIWKICLLMCGNAKGLFPLVAFVPKHLLHISCFFTHLIFFR